jgi:alkyl sulfatase BDS1-like metallo-beta-lactamase superfamily hydrolase
VVGPGHLHGLPGLVRRPGRPPLPPGPGGEGPAHGGAGRGGRSLPEAAREALAEGDLRWAAELADHWSTLEPDSDAARTTLAGALRGLGERRPSANGRHYYLTLASSDVQVEEGTLDLVAFLRLFTPE